MAAHILIVDESHEIQDHLRALLLEKGYIITTCSTINEVLEAFQHESFDLVLLEPARDPSEAYKDCYKIKETWPNLQILIVGEQSEEKHYWASKAHADGYLDKPYLQAELLTTINRMLTG